MQINRVCPTDFSPLFPRMMTVQQMLTVNFQSAVTMDGLLKGEVNIIILKWRITIFIVLYMADNRMFFLFKIKWSVSEEEDRNK
jgi:hypothetical protein